MIQFNSIDTFDKVWFTSDLHYGHKNIVAGISSWEGGGSLGTRDFQTLAKMNDALVKGINDNVKENDLLIHCGDWNFGGKDNIQKLREQLNVKTIFGVYGNHDHQMIKYPHLSPYTIQDHILYLKYRGQDMVICHYPMISHHRHHHGSWMIHGHCHGSLNQGVPGKILDVGVDQALKMVGEYRPLNFNEVKEYMSGREISLASHHSKNTN